MKNKIKIAELLNLKLPLVLASKSPRRKLLLEQLGFEFDIAPSHLDEENNIDTSSPYDYARILSEKKALAVTNDIDYEAIVLGADTIVVLNNEIINKPKDKTDAYNILRKLSNNTHIVYTGISLVNSKTKKLLSDVKSTEVTFRYLEDNEIYAYIETGSPLDKAGSYGIQDDFGAMFVSHINGCYYNIVGLPLELFYSLLKKFIYE